MKIYELWDTIANVKITEIIAECAEEAWEDYLEHCSEYCGTNDTGAIEIRYKPIT